MHITSRSGRVGEEKPIRLCFNGGPPPTAEFAERLTWGNVNESFSLLGRIRLKRKRIDYCLRSLSCAALGRVRWGACGRFECARLTIAVQQMGAAVPLFALGWKTAVDYADSKRLLERPHAVGKVLGLRELVGRMGVAVDARREHERSRNMRGKRDRVMAAYRFRAHERKTRSLRGFLDYAHAAFGEGHGRPHLGAGHLDTRAGCRLDFRESRRHALRRCACVLL